MIEDVIPNLYSSADIRLPDRDRLEESLRYLLDPPAVIHNCPIAQNLTFVTERMTVTPCAAYQYIAGEEWNAPLGSPVHRPEKCPYFSEDCSCLWGVVFSGLF